MFKIFLLLIEFCNAARVYIDTGKETNPTTIKSTSVSERCNLEITVKVILFYLLQLENDIIFVNYKYFFKCRLVLVFLGKYIRTSFKSAFWSTRSAIPSVAGPHKKAPLFSRCWKPLPPADHKGNLAVSVYTQVSQRPCHLIGWRNKLRWSSVSYLCPFSHVHRYIAVHPKYNAFIFCVSAMFLKIMYYLLYILSDT